MCKYALSVWLRNTRCSHITLFDRFGLILMKVNDQRDVDNADLEIFVDGVPFYSYFGIQ